MVIFQRISLQVTIFLLLLAFTLYAKGVGIHYEGETKIVGSVISTPCSVAMSNRYQTINFSSLNLKTISIIEKKTLPFDIELRNCGGKYNSIDSKAWTIHFDGSRVENINAFALDGPSQGLAILLLNNKKNILIPGEVNASFSDILRQDKSGQTFLLHYFLQLKLTGKPLQSGQYQGLVRFFIDYQ